VTVVDDFVDWASGNLEENDSAVAYLRGRGVSVEQFARHRLGYVAGDFDRDPSGDPAHGAACRDQEAKSTHCDSCRFNRWTTKWEEVDGESRKIRRVGRRIVGSVVLPLTTYSGRLAGVQVRSVLEKDYDTFLLKRRPEGYFFGLAPNVDRIWSSKSVFLVEGPFDQLVFERLVSRNVLSMTTNTLGTMQAVFVRRFASRVYTLLDRDAGGRDGAATIKDHLGDDVYVRSFLVPRVRPKDKDLNDYWKAVGDDAFREHFAQHVIPQT
jgi:DNA primase